MSYNERRIWVPNHPFVIKDMYPPEEYEPVYYEERRDDIIKHITENGHKIKIFDLMDGDLDDRLFNCMKKHLTQVEQIKLRSLEKGVKMHQLYFLAEFPHLKILLLQFHANDAISIKELNELMRKFEGKNLKELAITFEPNEDGPLEIDFPSTLTRVTLRTSYKDTQIHYLKNIVRCCPNLRDMDFFNFMFSDDVYEDLKYAGQNLPHLRYMSLMFKFDREIDWSFLKAFPKLRIFWVQNEGFGINTEKLFSIIPHIQEICFMYSPEGFTDVPDFRKLPNLKKIGLNTDQVGQVIKKQLHTLEHIKVLLIRSHSFDYATQVCYKLPNLTDVKLPIVEYSDKLYARLCEETMERHKDMQKINWHFRIREDRDGRKGYTIKYAESDDTRFTIKKFSWDIEEFE